MKRNFIKIDYDLNPGELNPVKIGKDGKIIDAAKTVANMSESLAIPMRMSVMEAIAEDLTDTLVEDENVSLDDAEQAVDGVVDKAVELHLVSSAVKSRIKAQFVQRRKKAWDLNILMAKSADKIVDRLVKMEEDAPVVDDVLDNKEADDGVNIDLNESITPSGDSENTDGFTPTKTELSYTQRLRRTPRKQFDAHGNLVMCDTVVSDALDTKPADDGYSINEDETIEYKGDTENNEGTVPTVEMRRKRAKVLRHLCDTVVVNNAADEVVIDEIIDMDPVKEKDAPYVGDVVLEPEGDNENTEGAVPTREMLAAVRSLAYSHGRQQKAKVALIRLCAGQLTKNMLRDLRYCLPEVYKKKYGIK